MPYMSALASPSEEPLAPPKRRRWLRALLGGFALILLAPVLGALGLVFWANTEGGRATLSRLVEAQAPGLSLTGLEGPLPGHLGLAHLSLADGRGVWLEVQGAQLAWDLWALLNGTLRIEALTAERLVVHRLPVSRPDAPPTPPGPLLPGLPQLPLAVLLENLRIGEIVLEEALLGERFVLRAEGRARLDPTGLSMTLNAVTPDAETVLALEAQLRPATGRLGANLTLRDRPGGPVTRILGTPAHQATLTLALDGPAEGAAFRLDATAGPGLSAQLQGTLRAPDTSRFGAEIAGRVTASALLPAPFDTPFDLALNADRMPDGAIDLRTATLTHASLNLAARGRVARDGQFDIALTGTLADSDTLAPLLPTAAPGWRSMAATGRIEGPTATPRITLNLAPEGFRSTFAPLAALLGPAPRLTLEATAPDRIAAMTLAGAGVQATLRGRAGETLDLTFGAEFSANDAVTPGITGALRLSGTARGPRDNPDLTLDADSARIESAGQVLDAFRLTARIAQPRSALRVEAQAEGRLQGLPLRLDIVATPEADGWVRLARATAGFGQARLTTEGRLHPERRLFEGPLTLEVPDLAPFATLLGRPMAGAFKLVGRLNAPAGVQQGEAQLEASRVTFGDVEARDLRITAAGTAAVLDLGLNGKIDAVTTEFRAKLTAMPDGARRLDISTLRIEGYGETARLAAPARITRRVDGGIEVAPLSLAMGRGATLRAEGRLGPERNDLRLAISPVPLTGLAGLLPLENPSGTLSAELRIIGATAAPELALTLRGTQLRAGARGLPPAEFRAEAQRNAAGAVTGRAELSLGPAGRITATLRLPGGPAGPAEGTLDGEIDFNRLTGALLAASGTRAAGRLVLALRLGGTLAAPNYGGEARLSGGSWRDALLGLALTDLAGTLRADGSRLRADLTGRAGAGRIALAGTLDPLAAGFPVDLLLTATEAQALNHDLLRATLDAELRLVGLLATAATLSGPIRVRRADIRVPERLPASVRSLGPVTERGTPAGRPPRPPPRLVVPSGPAPAAIASPIALALRVEAPRAVFVRGRGLDAELGGALAIGGTLAGPEITGELAMRRGDVQVLARRLAFERGRLLFDGGLMPALDFRATSQSGGAVVAVEITGQPSAPVIAFTSVPELPADEVLARLLFDRAAGQLSPFEIAQIAEALAGAAGLPGGGTAGALERVRQGLALDRLSVGGGAENASRSSDPDQRRGPTLEAGRYVAEGVYVGVRQGTDSGSSRVVVRVELTPRIRVEAEIGDREAGERVGVSWEWQWGR